MAKSTKTLNDEQAKNSRSLLSALIGIVMCYAGNRHKLVPTGWVRGRGGAQYQAKCSRCGDLFFVSIGHGSFPWTVQNETDFQENYLGIWKKLSGY